MHENKTKKKIPSGWGAYAGLPPPTPSGFANGMCYEEKRESGMGWKPLLGKNPEYTSEIKQQLLKGSRKWRHDM